MAERGCTRFATLEAMTMTADQIVYARSPADTAATSGDGTQCLTEGSLPLVICMPPRRIEPGRQADADDLWYSI